MTPSRATAGVEGEKDSTMKDGWMKGFKVMCKRLLQ
jgi:hypothetical protein